MGSISVWSYTELPNLPSVALLHCALRKQPAAHHPVPPLHPCWLGFPLGPLTSNVLRILPGSQQWEGCLWFWFSPGKSHFLPEIPTREPLPRGVEFHTALYFLVTELPSFVVFKTFPPLSFGFPSHGLLLQILFKRWHKI